MVKIRYGIKQKSSSYQRSILDSITNIHRHTYHQYFIDALFLEEHNEHVVPGQQPRGEVNSGFYMGLCPMQQVFLTLFATVCSYNSIVCTTLVQYACGPVVLKSTTFNLFKCKHLIPAVIYGKPV